MKLLKQLKNSIQALYINNRNRIALLMLHVFHRLVLNRIKKTMVKHKQPLHQTADELGPILNKVSQTINDKPEIVQATLHHILNEVQNIASSSNNKESANTAQSEESASILESTTGLEQKLRHLFAELNIAQVTGDKVAQQANAVMDKGFELTHQLIDSIQRSNQQNFDKELSNDTLKQWDDFIGESNQLSLQTEQLQIHVNQLLSSYEIN